MPDVNTRPSKRLERLERKGGRPVLSQRDHRFEAKEPLTRIPFASVYTFQKSPREHRIQLRPADLHPRALGQRGPRLTHGGLCRNRGELETIEYSSLHRCLFHVIQGERA